MTDGTLTGIVLHLKRPDGLLTSVLIDEGMLDGDGPYVVGLRHDATEDEKEKFRQVFIAVRNAVAAPEPQEVAA